MTASTSLPPASPEPLLEKVPLIQAVMAAFEQETGLHMSFDDFTGWSTGWHEDVPQMKLDWLHLTHSCDFCEFIKSEAHGRKHCIRNKAAVNRLVHQRREGISGYCHLGLFDMAEPLIFRGWMLGVFYYGSVLVKGKEGASRRRIRRHCTRFGIDPDTYLKELGGIAVIEPSSIPRHRETLKTVVRLAEYFCEAAGVRPDLYRRRSQRFPYDDPESSPYVVKEAMHFITSHIDEPLIVKDLAAHLRCHPDFLSRKFKQHTGTDLSVYIQHTRIERAKLLLENPKIDIGMAADQAGFSDRVHFSKVFRRVTGKTPGQYQKEALGKVPTRQTQEP